MIWRRIRHYLGSIDLFGSQTLSMVRLAGFNFDRIKSQTKRCHKTKVFLQTMSKQSNIIFVHKSYWICMTTTQIVFCVLIQKLSIYFLPWFNKLPLNLNWIEIKYIMNRIFKIVLLCQFHRWFSVCFTNENQQNSILSVKNCIVCSRYTNEGILLFHNRNEWKMSKDNCIKMNNHILIHFWRKYHLSSVDNTNSIKTI